MDKFRLNEMVDIDLISFTLAEDKLGFKFNVKTGIIKKISEFKCLNIKFDRAYCEELGNEQEKFMIQRLVDNNEIYIFKKIFEIYPQTKEEWNEWIDKNNGHLCQEFITTPDNFTYYRIWNHHTHSPEKAVKYSEIFNDNNIIMSDMMIFSRKLLNLTDEEIEEFLIVNDNSKNIDIYAGIIIPSLCIKSY